MPSCEELCEAVVEGSVERVKQLLQRVSRKTLLETTDEYGASPFLLAVAGGHLEIGGLACCPHS